MALAVALALPALASDKISEEEKLLVIRGLQAEIGLARETFPNGNKGVDLSAADGKVLNLKYVRQTAVNLGAAFHAGDRVMITNVIFKGDAIAFDLNGGLGQKKKWYEHLSVGMGGTMTPISSGRARYQGSQIILHFKGTVPHITAEQVKQYLTPLIDWNLHAAAEVQASTLPPRLRDAIKNHEVLVGMNTEMVLASRGRPVQRVRERDAQSGDDFEDWVYGKPPEATFVRVEGDRVIRVTEFKADGSKVERTQPEVIMAEAPPRPPANAGSDSRTAEAGGQRPTLRRPGDAPLKVDRAASPGGYPGGPRTNPDGSPGSMPDPGQPGGPTVDPGQLPPVPGQPPPATGGPGRPPNP